MIGKAIAAAVGAEVQRRHGGSGLKGAALGFGASVVAGAVIRRLGPIGLVAGGAWAAKQALDRRRATATPPPASAGSPPPGGPASPR